MSCPKIAATMLVRNEAPIVADSIGHLLLHLGVDRLYVADNGSTDATPQILARIAALDGRVSVRQAPGPYRPEPAMAALVDRAVAEGADWVMPIDADEFPWIGAAALRRRLSAISGAGAYGMAVRNFVQMGAIARDGAGSLRTMLFSAVPSGTHESAHALVHEGGMPFLRMRYPLKIIARATHGLRIRHGHHHADGLPGPFHTTPLAPLLHAPIRSRDDLLTRVVHGRRSMELSDDPVASWHLKRLVEMDASALEREWRKNSIRWWGCRGFRFDPRLAWIGHRLSRFRRQVVSHV